MIITTLTKWQLSIRFPLLQLDVLQNQTFQAEAIMSDVINDYLEDEDALQTRHAKALCQHAVNLEFELDAANKEILSLKRLLNVRKD